MNDEAWASAQRAASEAWPEINLDPSRFLAHAKAHHREGGALPEHMADLYLACAAACGDRAALRIFDERVLSEVDPVARRIDSSPAFVDELRQALRVHLLLGTEGAPPRIAAYQGRGPLVAWVRVAATRLSLNMKRVARPTVTDDEVLADLIDHEPDPALQHVKQLYRAEFGQALREALEALSERQRVLLRLHFVEGVRLARIGALYGVHESTASRWVQKAADDVAEDAKRRLRERLALSPASFESVARGVQSCLDLSISRLLGGVRAP